MQLDQYAIELEYSMILVVERGMNQKFYKFIVSFFLIYFFLCVHRISSYSVANHRRTKIPPIEQK